MGFHVGWIAVKSVGEGVAEEALADLGLEQTGESEEMADFDISGWKTPSGWYVVIFKDMDAALLQDDEVAQRLSQCVRAFVDETSMFSSAEAWADGNQQWAVEHDCEEGPDHLEVTGEPPEALDRIRRDCAAEQDEDGDDVDSFFEVPLQLAQEITGFKHDEGPEDQVFEELVAPKRRRTS